MRVVVQDFDRKGILARSLARLCQLRDCTGPACACDGSCDTAKVRSSSASLCIAVLALHTHTSTNAAAPGQRTREAMRKTNTWPSYSYRLARKIHFSRIGSDSYGTINTACMHHRTGGIVDRWRVRVDEEEPEAS